MACRTVTGRPSIAVGTPASNRISTSSGSRATRRVGRVRVELLDRRVPRVLEEAGLDRAAPEVLVDRVGRAAGHVDRQAVALGEADRLVPGHAGVPDRREHLQVGRERADADLEPDLVVALAGAAVRDGVRAVPPGGGDQRLDDHRPGQRRDERVALHVERAGPQRGQAVVVGEVLAQVEHLGLDGAAGERALADLLQVLAALADVGGDGDHLGTGLLGDPADGDGGVQASGVGEDDTLGHGCLLGLARRRRAGCRVGGQAGVRAGRRRRGPGARRDRRHRRRHPRASPAPARARAGGVARW